MLDLLPLPYAYDALQPTLSERALRVHHEKHHAAYVRNTNSLASKAGLRDLTLEQTVATAAARRERTLYNNAAQAWNHDFFWRSMRPGVDPPRDHIEELIQSAFGSFEALRTAFVDAGSHHFGSGWVWIVLRSGRLKIVTTHDAGNFLTLPNVRPLLVCDVWEHAYYLDHLNDRTAFLSAWIDRLANWPFAESRLAERRPSASTSQPATPPPPAAP